MKDLSQQTVVGLGELLWDCFEDSRRPGGAPANVAFHAAQHGCRGIVASRVGRDELGSELLQFLVAQGLETTYLQEDGEHPTGRVTVDASIADHPQYTIHENVAWDFFVCDDRQRELMGQASAVCFGTLAQRNDASRTAIHECLQATREDCLRVYDVNLRQDWYTAECIAASLQRADLVKLNDDELAVLKELLDLVGDDPTAACQCIRARYDVGVVCVTRAEKGCLLVGDSQAVDIPGTPVEVVDAVGAGDAFTATLISALLEEWPLADAGAFANRVGGLVASRAGAMPALKQEFAQLREEFRP